MKQLSLGSEDPCCNGHCGPGAFPIPVVPILLLPLSSWRRKLQGSISLLATKNQRALITKTCLRVTRGRGPGLGGFIGCLITLDTSLLCLWFVFVHGREAYDLFIVLRQPAPQCWRVAKLDAVGNPHWIRSQATAGALHMLSCYSFPSRSRGLASIKSPCQAFCPFGD